jgi:hypothetical protein
MAQIIRFTCRMMIYVTQGWHAGAGTQSPPIRGLSMGFGVAHSMPFVSLKQVKDLTFAGLPDSTGLGRDGPQR